MSTGHQWIKHGSEMVKLGASIAGGSLLGGFGALKGIGAVRAMGGEVSATEAMKMIGEETFKGGFSASTGSRGWLSVANRSLWGDEAFKSIINKMPTEETIIEKGRGEEEIVTRVVGDKVGMTEKTRIRRRIKPDSPPGGSGGGGGDNPPPTPSVAKTRTGELVQVVRDPKTVKDIQSGKWKPEGGGRKE